MQRPAWLKLILTLSATLAPRFARSGRLPSARLLGWVTAGRWPNSSSASRGPAASFLRRRTAAPVVAHKDTDAGEARKLRRDDRREWPWDGTRPPTALDFLRAAERARPSAPGPDGDGVLGVGGGGMPHASALCDTFSALVVGAVPPTGVNDSHAVSLPKGEGESGGGVWWADAIRPHSSRTMEVKLVTAVCARLARRLLPVGSVVVHRGFVPRRQLSENVADLSTTARLAAWRAAPGGAPSLVFLGLTAAFPRAWGTTTCGLCHGVGMQLAVRGLYSGGRACWAQGLASTSTRSEAVPLEGARCPGGLAVLLLTRIRGGF